MTDDRDAIIRAIAREEEMLERLNEDREQTLSRIRALKSKLSSNDKGGYIKEEAASYSKHAAEILTPAEKVTLFCRLFQGRDDVFPKLWTSSTGRKGYAPACANDWAAGVCGKTLTPRIKCGDCTSRKFLPITEQVILDHLRGKHVIGVYPMLDDDTCRLLAVDFDKESWMDDISAFYETCCKAGVPAAIERSRSGNGAHVWFFFTESVQASLARAMGCYLITETMSRRHQLGMDSYDRLFPSQDTLPKGGFGNLIALPLQHEPRQKGNTLFVDENFKPFKDQWLYLSTLQRISPETIQTIVTEAIRRGGVIGVPRAIDEGAEVEPWDQSPSRQLKVKKITGPLPKEVRAVLAQRLFVETKQLPSPMISRIKRLAAFQNPEFYKKQNMRLSTALTPRIISCFEELPGYVSLPRGCHNDLKELLTEHGIQFIIEDKRREGDRREFVFQGELTTVQREGAEELLKHDMGVFVAPPGSGKTVIGAYLVAARKRSTLIVVHRNPLLKQWVTQLSFFLGIPEEEIGRIGGGKNKPNGSLDVAMIQSLVRKGSVNDLVADYGQVIVDECHHLPAISFERVLTEAKARYITGLTATPYRKDGHQPIIHMQCGPVRCLIRPKEHDPGPSLKHRLICRLTDFAMSGQSGLIHDVFAALIADERRNQMILEDVKEAVKEGRRPLLLTDRKEHLSVLADRLKSFIRNVVVLRGGMSNKEQQEAARLLGTIPENEERLILATGRYIGEGFDDPQLDTLFLAMPFSWKGTIVQYTGRLDRKHPGKQEVRVYDYVDGNVPALIRMHKKRLSGFRAIGYVME